MKQKLSELETGPYWEMRSDSNWYIVHITSDMIDGIDCMVEECRMIGPIYPNSIQPEFLLEVDTMSETLQCDKHGHKQPKRKPPVRRPRGKKK